jgi:hypothetical protein
MSFTRFSLLSLLLMFFVFTTTSCEKEDPLQDPTANNPEPRMLAVLTKSLPTDSTGVSENNQCFVFNFPLSFVLEDGSRVTFENEDALADNMGSPIVNFVYPFTITLTDGTESSINNFEELFSILTTCFGEYEDWDDDEDEHDCDDFYFEDFEECFSIVYPLTIVTPDSSQFVFNSDDELFDFLDQLEEEETEDYDFVFPFQVVVESLEETVTIEDYDGLEELFEICEELYEDEDDDDDEEDDCADDFDFEDYVDCFTVVYPLSISGPDSTVTTFNSNEELESFLENLDEEEIEDFDFVFPFDVFIIASGETIAVDDYDALDDVFDACDD